VGRFDSLGSVSGLLGGAGARAPLQLPLIRIDSDARVVVLPPPLRAQPPAPRAPALPPPQPPSRFDSTGSCGGLAPGAGAAIPLSRFGSNGSTAGAPPLGTYAGVATDASWFFAPAEGGAAAASGAAAGDPEAAAGDPEAAQPAPAAQVLPASQVTW